MDARNLADVMQSVPHDFSGRLQLFLDYHGDTDLTEVPDPYHGDGDGFIRVISLVEKASDGLVEHLQAIMDETP